jgi:hypothetical protein
MKDRYVLGVGYLGYCYPDKVGLYKKRSPNNFESVSLVKKISKNILFTTKVRLIVELVKEEKHP